VCVCVCVQSQVKVIRALLERGGLPETSAAPTSTSDARDSSAGKSRYIAAGHSSSPDGAHTQHRRSGPLREVDDRETAAAALASLALQLDSPTVVAIATTLHRFDSAYGAVLDRVRADVAAESLSAGEHHAALGLCVCVCV
jgi:hypothetical protein